jgi:hypothetical protein
LKSGQGIPRVVMIREVSTLQLNKNFRKCCQVFAEHMEEEPNVKVPSIEDCVVLKEVEYVFK